MAMTTTSTTTPAATPSSVSAYLMSDCLIFASLFATYVVLSGGTDGGPGAKDLFELPFVAWETALLLTSSLTFGLGMIAMHRKQVGQMFLWLAVTWLLGFGFMCMEVYEFQHLIHQGYGPDRSAFLSAFFALSVPTACTSAPACCGCW